MTTRTRSQRVSRLGPIYHNCFRPCLLLLGMLTFVGGWATQPQELHALVFPYRFAGEIQSESEGSVPAWAVGLASVTILLLLSSVGALYWQHAQQTAVLAAQARRQAAVAELAQLGLAGRPLAELMEVAATLLTRTLGVDYSLVLEWRPDSATLLVRSGAGWNPASLESATIQAAPGTLWGNILQASEPVVFPDLQGQAGSTVPEFLQEQDVASGLGVPISGEKHAVGALAVFTSKRKTFTQDDISFLQSVAQVLATAVEHAQAREVLWDKGQVLSTLMRNLPGMVYHGRCDRRRTLEVVGEGSFELTGYQPAELIQDRISYGELIHPEDRDRVWNEVRAALATNRSFQVTYRIRTAAAEEKWVWERGQPVSAAGGEPVALEGLIIDITERWRLEQQLRLAQKMEAVGQLAGGVAHDFNNMLNVVMGYSEMVQKRLGPNHPLRTMVAEIYKAGERATSLTRQLLAFSRKQVLQPQVLNLNTVVAEMEKMLRRLIKEDIELVTKLNPKLGQVKADPGQMEQVIMNLALHARDAMPHGGRLTLETANAELDEAYARHHVTARPGRYVMLAVSDTGPGMDKETQARVFEPFFTTEKMGKGTGLGLSTVYGIVKQSGGWIWVYSETGYGTTFKIYFPRLEELGEAAAAPKTLKEVADSWGQPMTVLVAEDEASLRGLIREYLETMGYIVLEAENGAQAMFLAEQYKDPISLLMTDVVMPGMSGRTLAERVAARRPDIKVLYISGYPDDTIVSHGVLERGMVFLQKPFTLEALAHKLRSIFDDGR